MQKLVAGIHQFQTDIFRFHRDLFERLATAQNPDALFITCSDSRVNPNLITQTDPGDLFILRNAGNIVPPHGAANGGEGATIELAVAKLGIQDIIICGHSDCGAMAAMIEPGGTDDLPLVSRWLSHAEATRCIMREKYPHLSGDPLLVATVEENVLVQLENLKTHPVVAAGLAQGRLKLHGWVYNIQTGEVFSYRPKIGQFVSLAIDASEVEPMRIDASKDRRSPQSVATGTVRGRSH
jgi:carbonic anhydrase